MVFSDFGCVELLGLKARVNVPIIRMIRVARSQMWAVFIIVLFLDDLLGYGGNSMLDWLFVYNWWQVELWGNTWQGYAEAVFVFAGLWILFWILQKFILFWLEKFTKQTRTDVDDALIRIVRSIKPPVFFVLAVYLAIQTLVFSDAANRWVNAAGLAVVVYQAIVVLQILMDYLLRRKLKQKAPEAEGETDQDRRNLESALSVMSKIGKVVLWSVGFLFILSNVGVNVSSLIASLGIGGIAVALAAQNILGDLFSSLAIYFDKPFTVGDFIIVGDTMGTVKHIGIKTTRIKSLSGEEIVLPNQELTSARIQNYKRMEERRIAFNVGVTYQTSSDKIAAIPGMIEEIVKDVENVRFDRCHFKSFGDSALIFETVYHVTDSDYAIYMDAQQSINMAIKGRFEAENIDIAYPTQTVYVQKS